MPHVIAPLDAEGHAAGQVAPDPATDDAGAPLAPGAVEPPLRLRLLGADGALHLDRIALAIYFGHAFVFAELFRAQKVGKALLPFASLLLFSGLLPLQ